ncbi:Rapid ALkalinization Factor [Sesbania bispinosa]|nr:Rapid ALkalinization Factor [Sesbania bispinosa]
MDSKRLLVFLLLALVVAMVAEASKMPDLAGLVSGGDGDGDLIEDDNEFLMSSESARRALAGRQRYISYGALRANQVPCGRRGRSYYNCRQRGRANPYRRGCTRITHCARNTD